MADNLLQLDGHLNWQNSLREHLDKQGYSDDQITDTTAAMNNLTQQALSLAVFDLTKPDHDNTQVIQLTRNSWGVGMIVLTGSDAEEVSSAAQTGNKEPAAIVHNDANFLIDCLSKALRTIRESEHPGADNDIAAENYLHYNVHRIHADNGSSCRLTKSEDRLLRAFLGRNNEVISRNDLYEAVYRGSMPKESRRLDVLVGRLRRKLEAINNDHEAIRTVHGIGYALEARFH